MTCSSIEGGGGRREDGKGREEGRGERKEEKRKEIFHETFGFEIIATLIGY